MDKKRKGDRQDKTWHLLIARRGRVFQILNQSGKPLKVTLKEVEELSELPKEEQQAPARVSSHPANQRKPRNLEWVSETSPPEFQHKSKKLQQPPFKLTGKEKQTDKRKIPEYLRDVGPKIREQVQRSKQEFREKPRTRDACVGTKLKKRNKRTPSKKYFDDKENKHKRQRNQEPEMFTTAEPAKSPVSTADFSRDFGRFYRNTETQLSPKHSEAISESSSFSNYNPPQNVKEFYQEEFRNLLPEDVPRRLEPVELPLDGRTKVNSHSAYVFCTSSSEEEDRFFR